MKNARTDAEIIDGLEDVQVALDVLVAHLGVEEEVRKAIKANRAKAESSRIEIERSLGYPTDPDADPRR